MRSKIHRVKNLTKLDDVNWRLELEDSRVFYPDSAIAMWIAPGSVISSEHQTGAEVVAKLSHIGDTVAGYVVHSALDVGYVILCTSALCDLFGYIPKIITVTIPKS